MAAWNLLLFQGQDFLNKRAATILIFPNQEGTMEIRDEMILREGAQDLDTSEYRVSDLDDTEFYWGNDQSEVDAVFRPGIDTIVSPTALEEMEKRASAENIILTDEKTTRTLVQQHQSLRGQHNSLNCWEVIHLEQENKKGECSWLCLQKSVSVNNTVCLFKTK